MRLGRTFLAVSLSLTALTIVTVTGAAATAASCPTVSATGTVTPAPTPGVDWAGCDLTGADLGGTNMSGANLTGATMTGAYLTSTDLSGATLAGADLYLANIFSSDLSAADLDNASLRQSEVVSSDLSNADLAGVDLENVYSREDTGTPAELPADWELADGYLVGPEANLVNATLTSADLTGADLTGADAELADLSGSNLTGANLTGADLEDANLSGTDISNADLTGADLFGVESGQVTGTPAELPSPWILSAGCLLGPGANLQDQDLAGLNLADADLNKASLANDNFSGADLAGAILANDAVFKSDFSGADLFGAILSASTWTDSTCPGRAPSGQCTAAFYTQGFSFPTPGPVARVKSIDVVIRLQADRAGGALSTAIADDLTSARQLRVRLTGKRLRPVSAYCAWDATTSAFHCRLKIPRDIRTGRTHPYYLTVQEKPGLFVTAPVPDARYLNPIRIWFR